MQGLLTAPSFSGCIWLFIGADRPEPDYEPVWLLDQAKGTHTAFAHIGGAGSDLKCVHVLGGIKRGPIISYRFKLADAPTFINF